jgi:hypothetical protein
MTPPPSSFVSESSLTSYYADLTDTLNTTQTLEYTKDKM